MILGSTRDPISSILLHALVGVALLLGVAAATTSCGAPGTTLVYGDPSLDGCVTVLGNLSISGSQIVGPLSSTVQTVAGELLIQGTQLTSLAGLEALSQVGTLTIDSNPALVSLASLSSLQNASIVGISRNSLLPSLVGLGGLECVSELAVALSSQLQSLAGLGSLKSADFIYIGYNPALLNMSGLANLVSVGLLTIAMNQNMESLAGLEELAVVGELGVGGCPNLTTTSGLSGLRSAGTIILEDLPMLDDITSLSSLTEIKVLTLYGLPGLASLSGLESATRIDYLSVIDCSLLSSIDSLSSLNTSRMITLSGLSSLRSISALSNVTSLDQGLEISNNYALDSLSGLGSLVQAERVRIAANNLTSLDGLQALANVSMIYVGEGIQLTSICALCQLGMSNLSFQMGLPDMRKSWQFDSPEEWRRAGLPCARENNSYVEFCNGNTKPIINHHHKKTGLIVGASVGAGVGGLLVIAIVACVLYKGLNRSFGWPAGYTAINGEEREPLIRT